MEEPKVFKQLWKADRSLRPGVTMMDACIRNQPEALAIRDAWQFKHKVVTLSREEYADLIERCGSVTFNE